MYSKSYGLVVWVGVPAISKHLNNIYDEGELKRKEHEKLNAWRKDTAEFAKSFAESEFEKYRVIQDKLFSSDFDRFDGDNLLPLDFNLDNE